MACLVNSDRFLLISGQKAYFFEQIEYYKRELIRLETLYNKFHFKKKFYKDKYIEKDNEVNSITSRFENEILELRKLALIDKNHIAVNTEVDYYGFNKMLMNHESVQNAKRAVSHIIFIFLV